MVNLRTRRRFAVPIQAPTDRKKQGLTPLADASRYRQWPEVDPSRRLLFGIDRDFVEFNQRHARCAVRRRDDDGIESGRQGGQNR
jgi:hypothetical protein